MSSLYYICSVIFHSIREVLETLPPLFMQISAKSASMHYEGNADFSLPRNIRSTNRRINSGLFSHLSSASWMSVSVMWSSVTDGLIFIYHDESKL